MTSSDNSPITEWYKGKTIFITGGTGFMGKVLIEKLLFTCTEVKNIYVLMRAKKGKSPKERFDTMWKLPLFNRLRESNPKAFSKVVPLIGDLNTASLGLSAADLNLLITNTNIVFHLGATLKLEANLKDAVEQNTAGTQRVIDVCKQMKQLLCFVHYSTAFCSADIEVFEEKVYKCKDKPRDVIDVAKWMSVEALDQATKTIIAPHPNTYTYTKRLAETLVAEECENLPVCIIRPSVVTPAALEPLPGWVDSLNGPMGLLVGAGKGVIRSMHVKAENPAQVIPVDMAINASIVVAYNVAKMYAKKRITPEDIPVYNLTQHEVVPVAMGQILDMGRDIVYANPFEGQIWYPDGDIRSSYWVHWLYCIFFHWIPAYFIDLIMFICRQKRFMVYIQTRIHNGLELLQFFTVRKWLFRSQNFLSLPKDMTEADKKNFPLDFYALSIPEYLKISVLGARQYLMKEPLSSLPRCRIQQKILCVIHYALVYYFYWSCFSFVVNQFEFTRLLYDQFLNLASQVPVLNTFTS